MGPASDKNHLALRR